MLSRFALSAVGCAATFLVCGCSTGLNQQIDRAMTDAPLGTLPQSLNASEQSYGGASRIAGRGAELKRTQLVRHVSSPWIGGIQTVSKTEDKLPGVFSENFVLDFGTDKVSLGVVAARLTRLTNIPVRVRLDSKADKDAGGAGAGAVESRMSSVLVPDEEFQAHKLPNGNATKSQPSATTSGWQAATATTSRASLC